MDLEKLEKIKEMDKAKRKAMARGRIILKSKDNEGKDTGVSEEE